MNNRYTKEFKEDALRYVQEHSSLSVRQCSENLGINPSTLNAWIRKSRATSEVHRGSGNYESDLAKENARLKKEIQDRDDALYILKKAIGILKD